MADILTWVALFLGHKAEDPAKDRWDMSVVAVASALLDFHPMLIKDQVHNSVSLWLTTGGRYQTGINSIIIVIPALVLPF